MAAGPFLEYETYRQYAEVASRSADPKHFAVIDLKTEKAVGTLALMRIDRANGVIEVGSVAFPRRRCETRPDTRRLALSPNARLFFSTAQPSASP